MSVTEIFQMVDVIVAQFGVNGLFKSNIGTSCVMNNRKIQIRGRIALERTDEHSPNSETVELVTHYYTNAMSYRQAGVRL